MTRLVKVLGVATLLVAGIAFATSEKTEIYKWRYKTTVIVETPEGEKTGSAVREMTFAMSPCARREVEPCRAEVSTKGEAVVIDLGKRGIVFATMTDSSYYAVFDLFPGPPGTSFAGVKYYSSLKNAKASLGQEPYTKWPSTQYPMMVTFKDMKDPKTVELAYQSASYMIPNQAALGYKITDNFEKLFGKGVSLKSVTVEMTDENVTHKISSYLPSFGKETGFWEWKNQLKYEDYRYHIGPNSFN